MTSALEDDITGGIKSSSVDFLPCSITFDGPAPVSYYFQRKISSDGKAAGNFRGRELICSKISLPTTVSGCIVTKCKDDNRKIDILGKFTEINLWEHDETPNSQSIRDYFDWMELSMSVRILLMLIWSLWNVTNMHGRFTDHFSPKEIQFQKTARDISTIVNPYYWPFWYAVSWNNIFIK